MKRIALASTSLVFLAAASAAPAVGQSLIRLQGPGGRQSNVYARILHFTPDQRFALTLVDDGRVPGDANGLVDLAWYDLATGVATLAVPGSPADDATWDAGLSANGRYVVFSTAATNLGPLDTNGMPDAYRLDRVTGLVVRVSLGVGGIEPDLPSNSGTLGSGGTSDDGRFAVFTSEGSDLGLGANQGQQVYLRDLVNQTTALVSVAVGGGPSDGWSDEPLISADGRFVAFMSQSTDLIVGDTNGFQDVFIRDRQNSTTTRLNLGPGGVEADADAYYGLDMSPDGRFVVFDSYATNLTPGLSGLNEIFLVDRLTGQLTLESLGGVGTPSDGNSYQPRISDDGRYIVFTSNATTLDPSDLDSIDDAFVRDRALSTTRLASVSTGGLAGQPAPNSAPYLEMVSISSSGGLVGFETNLQGLVAGDTNMVDAFVSDRTSTVQPIESFCVAKVNSQGCTPTITTAGEPHLGGTTDNFYLSAQAVRPNQPGILLWSHGANNQPFFGGTLCVSPPVNRTPGQSSGGSATCSGTYSFHFSRAYMASKGLIAGTVLYSQYWSRDQGFPAPNNVGLTDGIRFTMAP